MRLFKVRFRQFIIRLLAALSVLFRRKHFFIVSFDDASLYAFCKEEYERMDINYEWVGMQQYTVMKCIKLIGDQYDEIDMALFKAEFEAMAHSYMKQNNNH